MSGNTVNTHCGTVKKLGEMTPIGNFEMDTCAPPPQYLATVINAPGGP